MFYTNTRLLSTWVRIKSGPLVSDLKSISLFHCEKEVPVLWVPTHSDDMLPRKDYVDRTFIEVYQPVNFRLSYISVSLLSYSNIYVKFI